MSKRTFYDLVGEAMEQLDREGKLSADLKCDKTARVLQAKIDEITETYLDDVPESFDDLEILECYIQEIREVIAELKADVSTFREWGRSYGLTEYAKAILLDADDVVQDLIFERSSCERAYDIVYEFIKNEEQAEIDREREHCTEESTTRSPYWDWGEYPTDTGTTCTGEYPTDTGTTCTGEYPTDTVTEFTGECSTETRSYCETCSTDDEGGVTVRNEKYEP